MQIPDSNSFLSTAQAGHPPAAGGLSCSSIQPEEVWCQQREASEHQRASHRYLTATDFTECHGRRATLKRIQLLEASVAAAVGVSMVYSSSALRAKPEYYRCCTV